MRDGEASLGGSFVFTVSYLSGFYIPSCTGTEASRTMPAGSLNDVFPIFAFIGFIIVLIPFPWTVKGVSCVFFTPRDFHASDSSIPASNWNVGVCLYIIWTALGCLNSFINSIIWKNNMVNWAPVWCDICE